MGNLDTSEIKYRARMGTLFSACEAQVEAGNVPDWIDLEFSTENLHQIVGEVGLHDDRGLELLKVAVFLDRALSIASANEKTPSKVNRELEALRAAHGDLVECLSELSPEAEFALTRVDEEYDEAGELTFVLSEPPIQEVMALLDSLGTWITDAYAPSERSGAKKSPKLFAIRLLRRLLHETKGDATRTDLNSLVKAIVDPVADWHGDESRTRDLVTKVLAETARA